MRRVAVRRRGGRAWVWLVVGLLLGGAAGAGTVYMMKRAQEGKGIPGGVRLGVAEELAYVPGDALGFVHVRARDVWKSEHLAEVRAILDKAGADALADLDAGFTPAPSSFDRLTVVFLPDSPAPPKGFGGPRPGGPGLPFDLPVGDLGNAVVVLAFSAPFDADRFRQSAMPGAQGKTDKGKEFFIDIGAGFGACFPADTVMVIGSPAGVEQFVRAQPEGGWKDVKRKPGPLDEGLKVAAEGGRHIVAGVNVKQVGGADLARFIDRTLGNPGELREVADELRALAKAEALAVGVVLNPGALKVDLRLGYANEADAAAAMDAVKPVADFARKKLGPVREQAREVIRGNPNRVGPRPLQELPMAAMSLFGLGMLNKIDDYLANPPVTREAGSTQVVATIELPPVGGAAVPAAAVGVGLLLPAVQKVREAAARMSSSNNLKQIGLAMHIYHDMNNRFPAAGTTTPPKKGAAGGMPGAGLSWRVHLLPYLEEDNLYRQFKMDEPWDSPNNKKLIPLMPKVYASPAAPAELGQTYYKVFVGGGAVFEPDRGHRFGDISDGTSNTILAVEGGDPVTWTKPDDIPFAGKVDPMSLSLNGNPRVNVALADGSVRTIDLSRISPETLKALITRAGGEVLGNDW